MSSAPRRRNTLETIRRSARRVSAKILNPLRSTSRSRARLSRVLLFYWLGIIAVIVLAPFRFDPRLEPLARALLFIPLGFLFPLTVQGRNPKPFPVMALGALLGGAFAAIRYSEAQRLTTTVMIAASGIGAGLGASILQAANHRIAHSGRLAGRLSLEIPLVALIYMLLPPLLTASLLGDDLSLVPLGLLGARLIAAAYEHHFAPGGVFRRDSIVVVAMGWMTLGVFPVVLRSPALGLALVLLVGMTTWRAASTPVVHTSGIERRFEADTLRKSVPSIVAYFIVSIGLPLPDGASEWRMAMAFSGSGDLSRQLIALLDPIASLAMLGYVLAEARGRRELPFLKTAPRIAVECAAVAVLMEVSHGFQPATGASALQFLLAVAGGVLGAGIYHSQRERLQSILIHRPTSPVPPLRTNLRQQVVVRS